MQPSAAPIPQLRPSSRTLAALSDEALVDAFDHGLASAFDELYRRHHRRLIATLRARGWARADAEELANDALDRAYRRLDSYRREAPFGAWLTTICLRLAVDRARRRQLSTCSSDELLVELRAEGDIEDLVDVLDVRNALRGLHGRELEAVTLVHLEGWTRAEAAEIARVPASTMRSRVQAGLHALQRRLDEVSSSTPEVARAPLPVAP